MSHTPETPDRKARPWVPAAGIIIAVGGGGGGGAAAAMM